MLLFTYKLIAYPLVHYCINILLNLVSMNNNWIVIDKCVCVCVYIYLFYSVLCGSFLRISRKLKTWNYLSVSVYWIFYLFLKPFKSQFLSNVYRLSCKWFSFTENVTVAGIHVFKNSFIKNLIFPFFLLICTPSFSFILIKT